MKPSYPTLKNEMILTPNEFQEIMFLAWHAQHSSSDEFVKAVAITKERLAEIKSLAYYADEDIVPEYIKLTVQHKDYSE